MTKQELQNKINDLCDAQIKNLERLTDLSVKESDVWAKDSEIQAQISLTRRELAKATLAESRAKSAKLAKDVESMIMDTAMKFMR